MEKRKKYEFIVHGKNIDYRTGMQTDEFGRLGVTSDYVTAKKWQKQYIKEGFNSAYIIRREKR